MVEELLFLIMRTFLSSLPSRGFLLPLKELLSIVGLFGFGFNYFLQNRVLIEKPSDCFEHPFLIFDDNFMKLCLRGRDRRNHWIIGWD